MSQDQAQKETKAQRIERLKREKNPWQTFDEVRAFARSGRGSVVPEWANTYFKWWGVYTQGDGVGATGGKGGEGLASDASACSSGELLARELRDEGVEVVQSRGSLVLPAQPVQLAAHEALVVADHTLELSR